MSNIFKTGLLLAVLTVMLVLLGGAMGGQQGMMIAFFFALAMNFVSYWFSDKIVLAAYGARPIDEAAAPRLYAIVHRHARRHPDAAGLLDPERDAERLCHRPQPAARRRGGDQGDHADPRRGRARGRAGPRALAREEPRRADLDRRRDARRRDHLPRAHGPVGRDVRRARPGRRRGGVEPDRDDSAGGPRADRGPARADGRLALARVPGGRHRRPRRRPSLGARKGPREAPDGKPGDADGECDTGDRASLHRESAQWPDDNAPVLDPSSPGGANRPPPGDESLVRPRARSTAPESGRAAFRPYPRCRRAATCRRRCCRRRRSLPACSFPAPAPAAWPQPTVRPRPPERSPRPSA